MASSIINSDDGVISGTSGIKTTGGDDGVTTFQQNGTEAMRIDSSGRLLVGGTAAGSTLTNTIELSGAGTTTNQPAYQVYAYPGTANTSTGYLQFFRSAGSTIGTNTLVGTDDRLGMIRWVGADGTDYVSAAEIYAEVDGTAGTSDMPGRIVFATTADSGATSTERMRITSDGYLRMASGTGGIQFGGDTAAANALDDYEEGTWTPTIIPEGGAFTTVTYDPNTVGRYTKIGNTVYIQGSIRTDLITVGTATGDIDIGGLPFTSISTTPYASIIVAYASAFAGDCPSEGLVLINEARIQLQYRTTSNGASVVLEVSDLGTGANANYIIFSGFYTV